MNELGHRTMLARTWRDIFATEDEINDATLDELRCWLRTAHPDELVRLLRVAHGAGRMAGKGRT